MEIQQAELVDAPAILAIQKAAYISEAERYNDFNIPPLQQTLDELKQEFTTHLFLKAVVASKIVGSVRAREEDGTCYIGRLIVLPEFQRQGIGSALLQAIENNSTGSSRFELFTGADSVENLALYQRFGYQAFKAEKLGNSVSLVFMEKQNTEA